MSTSADIRPEADVKIFHGEESRALGDATRTRPFSAGVRGAAGAEGGVAGAGPAWGGRGAGAGPAARGRGRRGASGWERDKGADQRDWGWAVGEEEVRQNPRNVRR